MIHWRQAGIVVFVGISSAVARPQGADGALSTQTGHALSPGFPGSGGPEGRFDWELKPGELLILNTRLDCIVNDTQTMKQTVVNGVVDVRNVTIGAGATLRVEGPNPLTIIASGDVEILGRIDTTGFHNLGVLTLNTTGIPESGAPGNAGGGRGGTGSPETDTSSANGNPGSGAFNQPGQGGRGGETGWNALANNKEVRRGAGGGGGRFGANQAADGGAPGEYDQTYIGLDAEPGFANLTTLQPPPQGANSFQYPPRGGPIGPSPFTDGDLENDFFGRKYDSASNLIVFGELDRVWAGAGGGGGGDASYTAGQSFPMVPFVPTGDEKGAGGGGGGGSIHVLALGVITFGPDGQVTARGGQGGGGENTNFVDRVGGGSGGGSGGHVVLESATRIDFGGVVGTDAILATGGQGGAGRDDKGGSQFGPQGSVETLPEQDACPPGQSDCLGQIHGAGGDGGPGVIQLHTPRGLAGGDIVLPFGVELGDICHPIPVFNSALEWLLPSYGRLSATPTGWLPFGTSEPEAPMLDRYLRFLKSHRTITSLGSLRIPMRDE